MMILVWVYQLTRNPGATR